MCDSRPVPSGDVYRQLFGDGEQVHGSRGDEVQQDCHRLMGSEFRTGSWGVTGHGGFMGSQGHGVTGSWGHRVTGSWGHRFMGSQVHEVHGVMGSWGHGVTGSWGHGFMGSQVHGGFMGSQVHGVTGSWGHGVTASVSLTQNQETLVQSCTLHHYSYRHWYSHWYSHWYWSLTQLSRSLKAGHRDRRTACLSAEDSNTHCSTTSSRRPLQEHHHDNQDVCKLPDNVVVDHQSSDIIERLMEEKSEKHKQALKQLETELTRLTQVCEAQVRTVSLELLSSLEDVDLRLNSLKDKMEHLDLVSGQEVCVLWEEVEEEVKMKKIRIMELKHKLTESETQRTHEIRVVLKKNLHLLQNISFLPPPDVCRLIHTEVTMLNQSLLANRRSAARLLLLLQEENLQQESLLRLLWEERLNRWRRSRVTGVIDRFRSLCSSVEEQQLVSGQLVSGQLVSGQLVSGGETSQQTSNQCLCFSSLVPPSCSITLVSDWFNRLTAVNQQIDDLHADLLRQLSLRYEQRWSDRLAEVELCEEELSALQLSEEEVKEVVQSQLLAVIGRSQSQDEERLAAVDRCCDSVARRALSLSRCVFVVMRGAALLWETHSQRLEGRRQELQQHLDHLRRSQQQNTQKKKVHLDNLLCGLRQESSEEALKTSLDKTLLYLQDVKHSCRQCVSDQGEVLDRLPSLLLEELLSYSSSLSSFFHLNHIYRPSPEELQNLHPSSTHPETSEVAEIQKPEKKTEEEESDPTQPSPHWLTEAESSLLDLSDIISDVTFTSSRGVAYSGPAFRCPAPDLPDDLQLEMHLSLFPVELLTHTLSSMRTLFLDHLEQRFHDVLSSAVAMVTDRKEAACSEQELQLKQLNPQHIETHIYQPRLAELQLHSQRVELHCEEVSGVLTSCRAELQEVQTSVSRRNQEFMVSLSNIEDGVLTANSSRRMEALSSTLQERLDQHIKDTQRCQTSFRRTVQDRLEQLRIRTTRILRAFRLFSEGGDFSPQEVRLFQRRLKEETKQITVTEESIYSELEGFESKSLKQLKEVSGRLEEKLCFLKSEVEFMEKIQNIISSTRVHIKAEAVSSKQQQVVISSRLENLRMMMENTQVSPDHLCSLLSSVNEELRKRCQYLDFSLDASLKERPSGLSKSRKQVQSAPRLGLLQTRRTGVDLLDDPVVGVIKSLNRFCEVQDVGAAEGDERGRPAAGQSPVQRPQQKCTESVGTLSGRKGCRSIRTERRFQVFGPEPEENPHSFSSTLNSVLWRANDVLLLVAEDFYRSERYGLSRFLLVPDSLDQWAESMQQRLLGYQEQTRKFLSTSREELETQLSLLENLLHSLPAVLISNHEQRQGAGLIEEVCRVGMKLEETLAASEEDKLVNVRQLRVSLTDAALQTLNIREELRQQQLQSAICSLHLELQVCLRDRGEEFVTSLASLTERLLSQLDERLSPEETEAARHSDGNTITMATEAETGRKHCTASRTWSGIPYLSPSTNSNTGPPSSVTTATTASITTTKCTLGHQAVIEQRDAAVKRFEQLFRSESSRSDDDKRRRLSELQSWNTHWSQQIHTLKHTL
ncbi:coiled-coil domain-containing protein 180 [Anoplopoma fimbria]|uniref:coiled-coil domain-containing protein 180 n=1 Tax=Anoplopoma fimbria TaxID=229290 RepID=UPI0023EC65D5|nr:coiled-coil domain-containing protein 180 [Anoplopoma fimbria]